MEFVASPKTAIGDVASTACERCKRRKIRCDRKTPCFQCKKRGSPCVMAGSGEKRRPVLVSYVEALERHVASLESFIQRVASVDSEKKDELLSSYIQTPGQAADTVASPSSSSTPQGLELAEARALGGRLLKSKNGIDTHQLYVGSTSTFLGHVSEDGPNVVEPKAPGVTDGVSETDSTASASLPPALVDSLIYGVFPYPPGHEVCQNLMAAFFKEQYPYTMCVYREFFLRDYDTGAGRYYSDVLLYAICAYGALAAAEPQMLSISELFASHAETLVYASLDVPDLTLLQALILLSYQAIGHGRNSKGWLFCGMAFRLAHEMGLHLDPSNWTGRTEPQIDREILRRVYWSAFNADKQISLYFGRPPALYPHESDVSNTIRIPYPDDWQGLLETYLAQDVSATAYEDGIALAGTFIYRVELWKIIHNMITDVFENRRQKSDSAVLSAKAHGIHVSLNKWLGSLPRKLHWTQWESGKAEPYVLHLHLLFHTAMIILHRPPRHLYRSPGVATSEDVEICYESLQAILRIMRSYSRFYKYSALPLDFVHCLSVTAGTILMKRFLDNTTADDSFINRSMDTVLQAMHEIRYTWPCVVEIRASVVRTMQTHANTTLGPVPGPELSLDFLGDGTGNFQAPGGEHLDIPFPDADPGELALEGFLAQ